MPGPQNVDNLHHGKGFVKAPQDYPIDTPFGFLSLPVLRSVQTSRASVVMIPLNRQGVGHWPCEFNS